MRALVIVALVVGCKVHRTFECELATDCGGGAHCEATHFCSFPDGDCSSGWRYDDYAGGGLASACVDTGGPDGGIPGCPVGYVKVGSLAGGYRAVSTPADWLAAEQDCEDDGAGTHLVIVDDEPENDALELFVISNPRFWMGATDRVAEGSYKTVANQPQTYLPWKTGEPDGANENCLENEETDFFDRDCTTQRVYICECDGRAPVPSAY